MLKEWRRSLMTKDDYITLGIGMLIGGVFVEVLNLVAKL